MSAAAGAAGYLYVTGKIKGGHKGKSQQELDNEAHYPDVVREVVLQAPPKPEHNRKPVEVTYKKKRR